MTEVTTRLVHSTEELNYLNNLDIVMLNYQKIMSRAPTLAVFEGRSGDKLSFLAGYVNPTYTQQRIDRVSTTLNSLVKVTSDGVIHLPYAGPNNLEIRELEGKEYTRAHTLLTKMGLLGEQR